LLETGAAQLHLGPPTPGHRLVEALYLKLQVIAETIRLVRAYAAKAQCPLFNLSPESFRVQLDGVGHGLPTLWSARVALVKPGQALALPVDTTGQKRFLPLAVRGRSIFLPERLGATEQATGSMRIRNLSVLNESLSRVEGTILTQSLGTVSPNDLVCVGIVVGGHPVKLYGHLALAEPAVPDQVRFLGLPQSLDSKVSSSLRAAEGVLLSKVSIEVIPAFGTPCDLFSLGVIAVRALLVDQDTTLPVALDELLSLARQVEVREESKADLAGRICEELDRDPRCKIALGPHRLLSEKIEPPKAADLLPSLLWSQTLAALVCFFPGASSDSHCRDFGDAHGLAPETIFDAPLETIRNTMRMTRSLIVTDWGSNRDVRAVIEALRTG
jgi:hypothetical protein